MDGKWEVTYMELVGVEQHGGGEMFWEFSPGEAVSTNGVVTASFVTRRDDTADPKRIDFYRPGEDQALLMRGIYLIDGEEMSLCMASKPDDHPVGFRTASDDGRVLFKLKRVTSRS